MSVENKRKGEPRQHGVKGVYYGGDWLDIEDCAGKFNVSTDACASCPNNTAEDPCPRSKSRQESSLDGEGKRYDVCVIGAGCIGAAIARELSRYKVSVLWVDSADDVSQGATKGNSGIVHAGYDDKPGTNRAKFCWKGNQMFAQLDKELRFGYQKNGSLVLALNEKEIEVLKDLQKRGETNGVERLRILDQAELREMEPYVNENAIAALYSPDAGNVIPYEFTIALAENAVDNGVELRIRREVTNIQPLSSGKKEEEEKKSDDAASAATSSSDGFQITLRYWEPSEYVQALETSKWSPARVFGALALCLATFGHFLFVMFQSASSTGAPSANHSSVPMLVVNILASALIIYEFCIKATLGKGGSISALVEKASVAIGLGSTHAVSVPDMLVGGSGCQKVIQGETVEIETITAKYIVNCAGGYSDKIAQMIGDDSFKIKPRLGDYLLLNRNQGHLSQRTLFPCPDPILGKGVLVQTTLWGNLILGPTARDMHKPEAKNMTNKDVQEYILSKCKQLVPSFDPKETIHAFCGARAKNSTGDWVIRPSESNARMIHAAGIDSPGLAGSPAIAVEVMDLLKAAGLDMPKNPKFNPNRAPIITPKVGMRGLKMGPVGKHESDSVAKKTEDTKSMASNVICKCEKVTELEVVRALRRSLPIDSSQGIRKRTRAGMGHCQGDPQNYQCEARVRAIIARENNVPIEHVGYRPWPATSTLSQRWIDEHDKEQLQKRMNPE